MAAPTITNGEEYFFPIIYEGNGAGQRVGKFVPFTDNGTIANSCIFEKGDSPRLNRTPSGTGTSRRKYTLSLWAKPSLSSSASDERYIITAGAYGGDDAITFDADRTLKYWINGRSNADFKTNRTFEDSSKFYHILVSVDTTQATASDRVKIYVDGDQITSFSLETYPAQNYDGNWGNTVSTNIGSSNSPNRYYNGYLAEVNYVDGTALTPSTFGLTDTSTGRWIPKTLSGITYGTNGFRLKFQDSSALGDDTSGNTNDFTATNLASTDQTTDSPTQNHMTFGGRTGSSITLSEGNLKVSVGAADTKCITGMGIPTSGKYYWEVTLTTLSTYGRIGVAPADANFGVSPTSDGIAYDRPETANGMRVLGTDIGSGWDGAFTEGNIMNFALDADNKFLYIGENNTWRNSGDPTSGATGTGGVPYGGTSLQDKILYPSVGSGAAGGTKVYDFNFGQKSLSYTPPTGYVTLQQDNLPETAKGISGLVWTKNRDATDNNQLYDSSRGKQLVLASNATSAEATVTDGLQKFLAGGQQIEDDVSINTAGESFVSWNWVANGGTTATNTNGSYSSTVQVNQTAGFSIVQFTPGSSSGTVGHGLSQAPEWIIMKDTTRSVLWLIYHKDVGADKYLQFTTAAAASNSTVFSTEPTATTFDPGNGYTSGSSYGATVAYCWHSVDGFSKFGSYTGNGSTNGPFIYTGFKPAFLIIKSSSHATSWYLFDNKRNPINPAGKRLVADGTFVEDAGTTEAFDFLSNGFKLRNSSNGTNGSGRTYIYMAFAEHPFVGDGTSPVTAR